MYIEELLNRVQDQVALDEQPGEPEAEPVVEAEEKLVEPEPEAPVEEPVPEEPQEEQKDSAP